ncbi:hypothetical protein HYX15_02390 [Candidatus Woesearchaeota archaeon]|nr:hypothetical protein [Candidatus Woesearchaeota archaeon]
MVKDKTQVGSPMNFRGMMYNPINEQGVVYLFGLVAENLNIRVESIQQGYPDCTAIRYLGKGRWERINIEFEYKSSNFDHDPIGCDVIVCWNDDLSEEQKENLNRKGVEVIELKSEIGGLDNPTLEDPDKIDNKEEIIELSHHIHNDWNKTKELFEILDRKIQEINNNIWRKVSKNAITYYSPEKVFIYMHPQKQGIKLHLFTNAEKINGVEIPYADALKWGRIYLKNVGDLDNIIIIIKKSHDLINHAIKEGLNTGWFAIPEKNTEMIEELKRTAEKKSMSGANIIMNELKED